MDDTTSTERPQVGLGPVAFHGLVAALTVVLLSAGVLPRLFTDDVNRYHAIATGPTFWSGQPVEFPPVAGLMVWFVGQWGQSSIRVLYLTNLVLDVATAVVVRRVFGVDATRRYLVLAALLMPLSLFRLDHLSLLLVVAGLALVAREQKTLGGAVLAAAVLTKLWPASLLSVQPRHAWRVTAAGVGTVLLGVLAWTLAFGGDAIRQVLTYRGAVGWHIESIPGSILRALSDSDVRFEGGAWRVGAPPAWAVLGLVVTGGVVLLLAWRMRVVEQRYVAVVAGLLALAPLFSLQYVLWLVPVVAVLPAGRLARRTSALVGLAAVLTILLGAFYNELLLGAWPLTLVLSLRNATVVGVLVVALVPERIDEHRRIPS